MKKILLRFGKYENVTPSGQDGTVILFTFTTVNADLVGLPEETVKTAYKKMTVSISRTLRETWGHDGDDLVLMLFEIGRRKIIERLRQQGEISDDEFVIVQQGSGCPFDPKRIQHPNGFEENVEIPSRIGF